MATIIPPDRFKHLLQCPYHPADGCLKMGAAELVCAMCRRHFAIHGDGVLDFVHVDGLSTETARELAGNTLNLTAAEIKRGVTRESAWLRTSYYGQKRRRDIGQLIALMGNVDTREIFLLGTGTGRDLLLLASQGALQTVYASDLALSALRVVPERLRDADIELGLFTADLNHCPVAVTHIPVVIVNALHHTEDMHLALERLLQRRYADLFLVEPTNNLVIKWLAGKGYAQRVEYSGVKPGRLEIGRLRALGRQYGYRVTLRTSWVFPQDYFQKVLGVRRFPALFVRALAFVSLIGRPFHFGNNTVAHLSRRE